MQDYYALLDVPRTATPAEIKRAYFVKVRVYSPEKFPEEFKNLRAAYETLSDGSRRLKYDESTREMNSLSAGAAELLSQASTAASQNLFERAEELLRAAIALAPKHPLPRSELGNLYIKMDKPGKAVAVFEPLCKEFPEDSEYSASLGVAYGLRSWRKKAIAELERAVSLNAASGKAWASLMDCYGEGYEKRKLLDTIERAASHFDEMGEISFLLAANIVCHCTNFGVEMMERFLKECLRLLKMFPNNASDAREFVTNRVLDVVVNAENILLFPYVKEMFNLVGMRREISESRMNSAQVYYDIRCMRENGYSELMCGLAAEAGARTDGCDDELEMAAMEAKYLFFIESYRTETIRLKNELPQVYAMQSKFFNEALASKNIQVMLDIRLKYLHSHGLAPSFLESIMPETFRRDEPQVGRNEPCPCGSGKKYKKCCGNA